MTPCSQAVWTMRLAQAIKTLAVVQSTLDELCEEFRNDVAEAAATIARVKSSETPARGGAGCTPVATKLVEW